MALYPHGASKHLCERNANPRKYGFFLSVKIEKAKDVAYKTTIKGREWANTIPVRGICPPSHSGFELPTFFISGRSIKKL